jgi:hypothetical protein
VVRFEQPQRLGQAAARWQADLDGAFDTVGAQPDGASLRTADGDDRQGAAGDGQGRRELGFPEEDQSSPSMM